MRLAAERDEVLVLEAASRARQQVEPVAAFTGYRRIDVHVFEFANRDFSGFHTRSVRKLAMLAADLRREDECVDSLRSTASTASLGLGFSADCAPFGFVERKDDRVGICCAVVGIAVHDGVSQWQAGLPSAKAPGRAPLSRAKRPKAGSHFLEAKGRKEIADPLQR